MNYIDKLTRAFERLVDEEEWLEEHGNTLDGYVARYGSKDDPSHYGDGGEAIYAADHAAYTKALAEVQRLIRTVQFGEERRHAAFADGGLGLVYVDANGAAIRPVAEGERVYVVTENGDTVTGAFERVHVQDLCVILRVETGRAGGALIDVVLDADEWSFMR